MRLDLIKFVVLQDAFPPWKHAMQVSTSTDALGWVLDYEKGRLFVTVDEVLLLVRALKVPEVETHHVDRYVELLETRKREQEAYREAMGNGQGSAR